ncbi:MAG: hypothetical protein KDC92_03105 [Bacteroidetes bacterium]|nr:hypothetical protein [Bacteroidota bacterium]
MKPIKRNIKSWLLAILATTMLSSCIVQHAKYADFDSVQSVTTGMHISQLQDSLGVEPDYVKHITDSGTVVYAYKYRLCEVKRIPIIMKKNSGWETEGPFVDLLVTANANGMVTHIETCTTCIDKENKTTIIDFDGIARGLTTLVTVTLPALLVFLSRN